MDRLHELYGQVFEWDAEKSVANQAKHGVKFETACEAFFDPFVRWLNAGDNAELREAVVGYTEDEALLFVVHVVRQEARIRIISARHATAEERREYEEER